jgi:ribonuclease R
MIKKMKFSLKKDPYHKREKCKYPNPIPSREYIIKCMDAIGKPVNNNDLVKAFSLKIEDAIEALRRRLIAMSRDGQIVANRRGSFVLVDKTSLVRGTIVSYKEGFGFLIPEDGGKDIFLPARQMRQVFQNDRVLVQVTGSSKGSRQEGVIIEILERKTTQIVGRYFADDGASFISPSSKNILQDLIVPKDARGNAKNGQLVVADITCYPTINRQAVGKIIEILGEHMAPGMEIEVAMRANNIPHKWPENSVLEARAFSQKIIPKDYVGRKDLRALPLITIDGEDARDFDDAVYCEKDHKNGWKLYIAIADVSYYVKPNTALDQSALARGNSVYFPDFVVPMLPEILSNELCSLKPGVDRLCMVCEVTISKEGKVLQSNFYEAVMRSHARLTYDKAAAMLSGEHRKEHVEILPHLRELYNLYKVLSKQREIRGAIEFKTIETRIIFGKNRKIKKIVPVKHNVAHSIIEECMLLANVCSAKLLLHKKIPALYRVHEGPNPEKLERLCKFLHSFGLSLPGKTDKNGPKPADYARLLQKVKGLTNEHLIQKVLLRSMRQAVYDEENIGHFGLAYEAYGHFTSPIRRYPDLLTHRAIRHAIAGGEMANFYYDNSAVHNFGEHCSMTERRADDATRDAVDWLKCEYMLDKLGFKFEGIISHVTNFGLIVELKDIFVEGLVHITALPNDYYTFDATSYSLIGKRLNKHYKLGDRIRVQVARVSLDDRQVDFVLAKG